MIRVLDAQFAGTAVDVGGGPGGEIPEMAFVGRSNVGKSSLINALAQRNKLVRVSNTPGRTRTLNFFDVRVEAEGVTRIVRLADLPGYGYAKVSKDERSSWEGMASGYLERRRSLRGVVSLIDAEVGPTPDDQRMVSYLSEVAQSVLVVATKIDRVSKAHRVPQLRKAAEQLEIPFEAIRAFSAKDGTGFEEVWEAVLLATYPSTQGKA